MDKTIEYALKFDGKYDFVIMAHTHKQMELLLPKKTLFYNTGSCSDGTFEGVLITPEGIPILINKHSTHIPKDGTLLISDLHLGKLDGADDFGDNDMELILWIDRIRPKLIIIVGDYKDLLQAKNECIDKRHATLIHYLRNAIKIRGNHDFIEHWRDSYTLKINGKSFYISHGYQLETHALKWYTRWLVYIYGWIERLMGQNSSEWIKKQFYKLKEIFEGNK